MTHTPEPQCDEFDPGALSIKQARKLILDSINSISETQLVTLREASGRTTGIDMISEINVPASRCSAMDGYAFRTQDIQTQNDATSKLKIVGKSLAGHPYDGVLKGAECVRITTGAVIPNTCNCVIMQEHVKVKEGKITFKGKPKKDQFIREIGSNICKGQTVLPKGRLIGPAELGLLATIGIKNVSVVRHLKIAVFSTGDELVEPGEKTHTGQIYDSNRFILYSLLQKPTIKTIDLGIVPDTKTALHATFEKAVNADLIISTGGVSVGEADYVKDVLESRGKLLLWKIAMKPGRPLTVGKLNTNKIFLGLPGNPVSGMVAFELFIKSAINRFLGIAEKPKFQISAVCQNTLHKTPGRVEFQRGILDNEGNNHWVVRTTGLQDSHILTSMQKANCYIVLEINSNGSKPGDIVNVMPFMDSW